MVTATRPRPRPRGFTFLEVLIVMAIMAVLMGIGVGVLSNLGRQSLAQQARAILKETAYACKQSSNGDVRATLELRWKAGDEGDVLVVGAAAATPVLTHQFESLQEASLDYPIAVQGRVEAVDGGYTGRAARFERGSYLELAPQSVFAMTEGLSLDVRLKPAPGLTTMTLLRGEGAYDIALVKPRTGDGYDVRLKLNLKDAEDPRSQAQVRELRTQGGPVAADGSWVHLQVRYDGEDLSVRVDGIERMPRRKVAAPGAPTPTPARTPAEAAMPTTRQRLVVPPGGALGLVISAPDTAYVGLMDNLVLGGVFRASGVERELRGLRILRPKLPLRVTWFNGRLDPAQHTDDVAIVFQEAAAPDGPVVHLRLGLHGTIEDELGAAP